MASLLNLKSWNAEHRLHMVHISCLDKHINIVYYISHRNSSSRKQDKERAHVYTHWRTDTHKCTASAHEGQTNEVRRRGKVREAHRGEALAQHRTACVCVAGRVQLFGQMSTQMNCEEHLRHPKSLSHMCTHSHTNTHNISYTHTCFQGFLAMISEKLPPLRKPRFPLLFFLYI